MSWTWNFLLFTTAVTCGLPPIPKYGKLTYYRKPVEGLFSFGFAGQYECAPPYALFGNERAYCAANGRWAEPPECRSKQNRVQICNFHELACCIFKSPDVSGTVLYLTLELTSCHIINMTRLSMTRLKKRGYCLCSIWSIILCYLRYCM